MADLTDAANALGALIQGIVYPLGLISPPIVTGPVWIMQGWPEAQRLQTGLAAGEVFVSIFPLPGDTVTSTFRGDEDWWEVSNTGTTGVSAREVRRQTRKFQITIWANCFDHRDPLAAAIDAGLAAVSRLTMPDGTGGVLTYVNSMQSDDQQKAGIYRRDLIYAVNYATIQTDAEYTIKHTVTNTTTGPLIGAVGATVTLNI
jgi:hypothetical protein